MPGRLAIDFGTSNTLFAVWDENAHAGRLLHIPGYANFTRQGNEQISIIPSLIHYTADNRRWVGQQVLDQNLYASPQTFRWMKRYISNRSPIRQRINGRDISPFDAGGDFLKTLLVFAAEQIGLQAGEEVAFCTPVEAYEHYENWLINVAESAGIARFRLIDEPSAAALGYGAHLKPGNAALLFDFGGGTMHAAIVLMEQDPLAANGQRCRILGKAGREIGGSTLDQWLYQEVLRRNNRSESDPDLLRLSNAMLIECERAKEQLSFEERAEVSAIHPETGAVLDASFSRAEFEELLDQHGLYTTLHQTIRAALNAAHERGYTEDQLQAIFMVGGSSQIPSIQRTIQQMFGRERVYQGRPLDAVVLGAAAFAAGASFFDHIQHDYAIRYVSANNQYEYRVLVPRGTPYPSEKALATLKIKATFDGQQQLGLAIFEMGQSRPANATPVQELVFDPNGVARLVPLTATEMEERSLFWMNENSPTFLTPETPPKRGEACFQVEFRVDASKRLTITVHDLRSGKCTHRDYPVVKLT